MKMCKRMRLDFKIENHIGSFRIRYKRFFQGRGAV